MNLSEKLKIKRRYLILGGLAAGVANGLLGAGGGIIIVWILQKAIGDLTGDSRDVFANALAVMLPISAVSAISYAVAGSMPRDDMSRFILPAILGGLVGAYLLDRLSIESVKTLFCVLVVLSGIIMVIGR